MKAGFARAAITPPVGTPMMGFAVRDRERGCEGAHDDLFVRALWLGAGADEALVMGFDLCFLGRADADRLKGAIGRRLDLAPRRILLNTSHTHAGPAVGTWAYAGFEAAEGGAAPDPLYLADLEAAVVRAACEARGAAQEVTLWAGATRSALPLSRRKPLADGTTAFRPNPDGLVCDHLPLCLLKNPAGQPVALLWSVSCHPSTVSGFLVSADYPGVAMQVLDAYLGTGGSLFLQGAGGDAKPRVIGEGEARWRVGTWDDVAAAGALVAEETIRGLEAGLVEVTPELRAATVEMEWPLEPPPARAELEAWVAHPDTPALRRLWARRQLHRLDRDGRLPASAPITVHGLRLGRGLRLVGLEGEAVAELGLLVKGFYDRGVTFPLGYCNGQGAYLPTSRVLEEGGYEADSAWEYGYPARFAKGTDAILLQTLRYLKEQGIS